VGGGQRVIPDGPAGRAEAIEVLRAGGIVALPTDTVYGIAVALATPGGIERLFHVKHRPPDKAIALLLADAAQAAELAEVSPAAAALAAALWPGPLTLVLRARPDAGLPDVLVAGSRAVGVRLPDHPAPRALAAAVGPLPTTSANLSGRPDPLDAATVIAELGDGVDLVLDGGRTPGSRPSTVVDLTVDPPAVLRVGLIDEARVRAVLAGAGADDRHQGGPCGPGRPDRGGGHGAG
jgi:L-threonylcarbamoyladenylate synthase